MYFFVHFQIGLRERVGKFFRGKNMFSFFIFVANNHCIIIIINNMMLTFTICLLVKTTFKTLYVIHLLHFDNNKKRNTEYFRRARTHSHI